jgi:predicted DNA-binding ribbon-helix-helix protein
LALQQDAAKNSTLKKRSIVIGLHKTSISLEDDSWTSLRQIARNRHVPISDLIASLDAARENSNLSSAIRVFILDHMARVLIAFIEALCAGAR